MNTKERQRKKGTSSVNGGVAVDGRDARRIMSFIDCCFLLPSMLLIANAFTIHYSLLPSLFRSFFSNLLSPTFWGASIARIGEPRENLLPPGIPVFTAFLSLPLHSLSFFFHRLCEFLLNVSDREKFCSYFFDRLLE